MNGFCNFESFEALLPSPFIYILQNHFHGSSVVTNCWEVSICIFQSFSVYGWEISKQIWPKMSCGTIRKGQRNFVPNPPVRTFLTVRKWSDNLFDSSSFLNQNLSVYVPIFCFWVYCRVFRGLGLNWICFYDL